MSLRRFIATICAMFMLTIAVSARADWQGPLSGSQTIHQSSGDSAAGVAKDDSRLTVVEAATTADMPPTLDVAAPKKTKKNTSIWNRLWHPSSWFSKSKK